MLISSYKNNSHLFHLKTSFALKKIVFPLECVYIHNIFILYLNL